MFASLLKQQTNRLEGGTPARTYTLPAPIGGWNAREALQAMKPEDAVVLDNIIPDAGRVRLRPGFLTWATGLADDHVESLMEYAPPSGLNELFGASPSAIYEVTASGAVGAAVVSSLNNARWQSVNFATTGGNFLCLVNGEDNYRTYDGATFTDQGAAVTGVTSSDLIHIAVHASRLWFVKAGSLDVYYLPTAAITGAATLLPLGPLCKKGGELLAVGSWTKDGGDGLDDYFVAVTTKGEVVVYQGTDPSSADTWTKVGVFEVSEPVGRRCLIKVGGDLGIITSTGVSLLSQLIGVNRSGQRKVSITNKISRAFQEMYLACGTSHGWQIIEFPRQGLVIVNVPVQERAVSYQFVVNTETGAWCRFTGINANCWSLKGDELFFGTSSGTVCKFGDSEDDDGEPINFIIQTAFNKCGSTMNKIFKMVRALFQATPGYAPNITIKTDYDVSANNIGSPAAYTVSASEWDVAEWDVAEWGAGFTKRDYWQTIEGEGRAVSVVLSGSGYGVAFEFNEIDVLFEQGAFI